ncbi:hypothetical protein DFH09DRAFT_1088809 [Mycena vulgaris]|nr:hypothetical protein DFH09DRAFT_1088809 [Mycena vulgaris]
MSSPNAAVFSLPRPRSPLLVLCLLIHTTNVILTSLTIDDTNTTYFTWPEGPTQRSPVWANASTANPCVYCAAHPEGDDPTTIYEGTWHDGSVGSTRSLTFQGALAILRRRYPGPSQFVLKALLFEAKDLAPGENHTVSWLLSKSSTNGTSALFDYAVVTMDTSGISPSSPTGTLNPSSSAWVPCISQSSHLFSSRHSKVGPIVGGIPILAGGGNPSSRPMGAVEPLYSGRAISREANALKRGSLLYTLASPWT